MQDFLCLYQIQHVGYVGYVGHVGHYCAKLIFEKTSMRKSVNWQSEKNRAANRLTNGFALFPLASGSMISSLPVKFIKLHRF